jgi:predicted RND superfamily exporter protein
MVLRVKWMDASSYRPFVDYVEARAAQHVGDMATVRVSGSAVNLLTVVDGLLQDLLRSFGAAFVVVSLMMVLLLRELRFGLLAMLPNLLPITVVMGFMGWVGIPIDLNNILIGSIAIGIAVDDTIHLMHHYRSSRLDGNGTEAAIMYAFLHSGRAMVLTTVILVFGFMVFSAAEMVNIQRFGMLIALTLVLALFADLIFAPALLRAVHPDRGTKKGGSHEPSTAN